jgi:hypothetical protein
MRRQIGICGKGKRIFCASDGAERRRDGDVHAFSRCQLGDGRSFCGEVFIGEEVRRVWLRLMDASKIPWNMQICKSILD